MSCNLPNCRQSIFNRPVSLHPGQPDTSQEGTQQATFLLHSCLHLPTFILLILAVFRKVVEEAVSSAKCSAGTLKYPVIYGIVVAAALFKQQRSLNILINLE